MRSDVRESRSPSGGPDLAPHGRMKTVSKIALTGLLGLGACIEADPTLGETQSASTVNDFGSSGGCSTAVVIGLSSQIADEIGCMHPGTITHFDTSANLV